jgi:FkbH-like protein
VAADLYAHLTWLPKPPADFRERCRNVVRSNDAAGNALARLAGYALDENQLRQLARAIREASAAGRTLEPLSPFKLAVVGNGTLDYLVPLLVGSAARHGIALECMAADFGQTAQEAFDPDSSINRWQPDAVLLALDYRGLPFRADPRDEGVSLRSVDAALGFLGSLRDGFGAHGKALSIVQTLPPPPETLFGGFDRCVPGTPRALVDAFNAALVQSVRGSQDVLFDVAGLAETVGLGDWHSPKQWNLGKLAFDSKYLPLYAEHCARLVGALRGKSRRCLILDLDNTVWGGIIGDDGIEGIVLGQGNATGEAYLEVQRTALALRDRGVVLAVSSKNDDATARLPFRGHTEMLLQEDHIAVFQANWDDKATNIAAIASALSLGTDAMVFLDDNPVERGLIRKSLPEVAVPELPPDPAYYARTLSAAGYFEGIAFSTEDAARGDAYQANARRVELRERVGDLEGYLASLEMQIDFRPFDAPGRARIAQLVNKSNQFNLTTRRYNEAEIAAIASDPACFTLQVRLVDTFGDNGMIGVNVCREISAAEWEIDTWLMSCRVLGRRVEQMVLREILQHARGRGVERVIGVYRPTDRNGMVREHYDKLGFRLVDESESGERRYEISTGADVPAAPMSVVRSGFDEAILI